MRLIRDGQVQRAGPGRIGDVLGAVREEHQARGCPGNDAYELTVSSAGVHAYRVTDEGGDTHRLVTA